MKTFKNRPEVLQVLRPLIADTLCAGNGQNKISEDSDLRKTFRVHNAAIGQLAQPIAKHFGCEIKSEEARRWQKASDIVDWLESHQAVAYEL